VTVVTFDPTLWHARTHARIEFAGAEAQPLPGTGSVAAMTDEQRKRRTPVVHALFLTHRITDRKELYSNESYAVRISELPQADSDQTPDYLFRHQWLDRFCFELDWNENDLLSRDDPAPSIAPSLTLASTNSPDAPLPGHGHQDVRPLLSVASTGGWLCLMRCNESFGRPHRFVKC
jgi:hypothetical protein